MVGAAQPDLDRVRGAVRRSRRRFRHPVQRALSRRPLRGRRSEARARARRAIRRRAADACRRRDRGRLPLVPADRLSRRLRARPDRRHGHDRRVPHQHHAAARVAHGAQPAGRAGAARLRVRSRRSTGSWSAIASPIIVGTALVSLGGLPLLYFLQFDFNPINLRNPQGRVDRDLPRPAQRSDHRRELDQRAGARSRRRRRPIAERLSKLPEVSQRHARSISSFPPIRSASSPRSAVARDKHRAVVQARRRARSRRPTKRTSPR